MSSRQGVSKIKAIQEDGVEFTLQFEDGSAAFEVAIVSTKMLVLLAR